jgi:uncharacterized phiE125 gp8 family phage protein
MPLELVTAPTTEIISLATAKGHLRVDGSDEDSLITDQVTAARERIEEFLGRQLITATWRLYLDEWPTGGTIRLPKPTLQTVTSIKYLDSDGVEQTVASTVYDVDIYSVPARIRPAWGQDWPVVRETTNSIKVLYVSGYGDAATDIPTPIIKAAKLLIGHLFENREEVVLLDRGSEPFILPEAMDMLLDPYIAITESVSI